MIEHGILTPKWVLLYRIDVKSKGRVTREAAEKFSIGEDCLFSKSDDPSPSTECGETRRGELENLTEKGVKD
jgi:hypothetical protein